jgi:hypothetical protein
MSEAFSIELQQFIDHNIESLAQLEAMLLLHGEPQRAWSADDVAKNLYITPEMAAALLADLARRGFAQSGNNSDQEYAFRTGTDEAQLVAQLAEVYQERRVAVITQIYSKPVNKVQTFADAFRLRKEE